MTGSLLLIISAGSSLIEKRLEAADLQSFTIGRGTDATLFLNDPGISRTHCKLYADNGAVLIEDAGSSGGTWINARRISTGMRLRDGDEVQIGGVRITIKLEGERAAAAAEATVVTPPAPLPPHHPRPINPDATLAMSRAASGAAFAFGPDGLLASADDDTPSKDISVSIDNELTIGRDASCDLALDNLMISRRHARVFRDDGAAMAEDLGSTNGTFLNDRRLLEPRPLHPGDALGVGPYRLIFDGEKLSSEPANVGAEIVLCGLGQEVLDRQTGRPKMLLRDISLTIRPRQFVGLLGTSGAGKSTFVGAVSGRRPGTHGEVLLNGENLYARFESLKAGIGFVPQDVIFHDSLPLIEALRYTSRLRLSNDASDEEIEANLDRVLKTVGLTENRETIIRNLSGGQKKRVSTAMELLSQPRILFLDEVTSGLDPRTEKQMMKLFRELADSGITVICITHYANSVEICDQIAYLNKGLLTFYGSPAEYKRYFGVEQIEAAYDLEEQKTPAQWEAEFRKSTLCESRRDPDGSATVLEQKRAAANARGIDWSQFRRQLSVLTRRYVRVLSIDRRNLLLLLGLPPLTAILLCILSASMEQAPAVFNKETYGVWLHKQNILCFGPIIIMFLLSMFGSVREIVKEVSIYQHERFVTLRIIPYLLSKIGPLAVVGAVQTLSVVIIINAFADMKAGSMLAQFITLFLVSMCGMLAGLAISASVASSDWAVMLMIGVVIPQLLFAGALVPVRGASAFIGEGFISAYWALESLRRLVEDFYIDHDVGIYHLPERSHSWAFGSAILVLHVFAFALLTFFLMGRKDGAGAAKRIAISIRQLVDEYRGPRVTADASVSPRPKPRPKPAASRAVAKPKRPVVAIKDPDADEGETMTRGGAAFFGGIVGLLLGYPLSYFLQPGALRQKLSVADYVSHIKDVLGDKELSGTAIGTWIACILIFALVGAVLHAMTRNRQESES